MKAVIFDKELKIVKDMPKPIPQKGEALIKINIAGICNTDNEIIKGYMGFSGILGHEFVGIVEEINDNDQLLLNKRVVGEINCGCGDCDFCAKNMQRHCPNRNTLGIFNKNGCMAEYLTLPIKNLFEVPDSIDDKTAVLTEPFAAAMEILEQIHIKPGDKVAVLGDGKLGILISYVLSMTSADLVLIGKHAEKLKHAQDKKIKTKLLDKVNESKYFDFVVDATGSVSGFETAISLVKPRGCVVLKSTIVSEKPLNLTSVVVDEITIVGSRCGQFKPALELIEKKYFNLNSLIAAIYPFEKALEAFQKSIEKNTMKVLIDF